LKYSQDRFSPAYTGDDPLIQLRPAEAGDRAAAMSVATLSFHEHIEHGDLAAVKRALLTTPAVLHALGSDQRTALHVAAEAGHLQILRFLLQRGADFAAADAAGEVPLMLAARQVGPGAAREFDWAARDRWRRRWRLGRTCRDASVGGRSKLAPSRAGARADRSAAARTLPRPTARRGARMAPPARTPTARVSQKCLPARSPRATLRRCASCCGTPGGARSSERWRRTDRPRCTPRRRRARRRPRARCSRRARRSTSGTG
jgi:hypothetical protein